MATTFKVWVDSPDDSSGGNVLSVADFASDSTRSSGYVPNTTVPSKKMNTILRETSLVITALMDQFCSSSTVTYISTLANVKAALGNAIATKSSVTTVASDLAALTTTVGNITSNSGPIKAVDTRVDNIVNGTTTVGRATIADNVGDITNNDTGSNAVIAFSIGSGANKKSYSKTITVPVPGTATNAETVTTNIRIANNAIPISNIFSSDGSALSAIHADNADSAINATNADYATTAGSATNATNASSANHATTADSAYSCTEAAVADQATQAQETDFTHSGWTTKDIGVFATLTKGATYEVQVNESSADANEWYCFPLITIATGNSGGTHAFCIMSGVSFAYTEFTYDLSLNAGGVVTSSSWQTSTKWRYRKIR